MKTPMTRRASHLRDEKWKKIWRILKVFRKWKGTRHVVVRTTYRIESVLSSFVPWLFHNRLWYNSACSCIPYVYVPAMPTSGRVNTISRYAHVAYLVWRIYYAICLLVTLEIHRVRYRFALHFEEEIPEFILEIYQEINYDVLLTALLYSPLRSKINCIWIYSVRIVKAVTL